MKLTAQDLERAIIFATEKHSGQVRKSDGRPYILHPLAVMQTMYEIKKSKNMNLLAIVCVLHDTVEDCNVTLSEIAENFGYSVASIIEELTSCKESIKELGKAKYLAGKMSSMSSYALVIKLIDRLNNVSDLNSMPQEFKNKYVAETFYIIKEINTNRKLSDTHLKLMDLIVGKIETSNI